MKYWKVITTLLLSMCFFSFSYAANSLQYLNGVDPDKSDKGDIIRVYAKDLTKYCDFQQQIIRLQSKPDEPTIYLCVSIGYKRKPIEQASIVPTSNGSAYLMQHRYHA